MDFPKQAWSFTRLVSLSALLDVFRSIRRGVHGPLACPNCGASVKRSRAPLEGWILPTRYLCEKCGYSGFLALEEEPENAVQPRSEERRVGKERRTQRGVRTR